MLMKDYNIETYDTVSSPSHWSAVAGVRRGLVTDKIHNLLNITIWKINKTRRNHKINNIINE